MSLIIPELYKIDVEYIIFLPNSVLYYHNVGKDYMIFYKNSHSYLRFVSSVIECMER